MLFDAHVHLDFLTPASRGQLLIDVHPELHLIAQTLTPSGFRARTPDHPGCSWSLGYHPWWIEAEEMGAELEIFRAELPHTRLIGEIGLDFSPRRLEHTPAQLQEQVFTEILSSLKPGPQPYVLSIHAVRSASAVLDILEEAQREYTDADAVPFTPVIHWFSGTSDELTRLIRLGGYASINPRMLESKRGRAYVRQLPADRILLETDLPAGRLSTEEEARALALQLKRTLKDTLATISELCKEDMLPILVDTQRRLYGTLEAPQSE